MPLPFDLICVIYRILYLVEYKALLLREALAQDALADRLGVLCTDEIGRASCRERV